MADVTLVAGATGELGREVVRALKARGQRVRAISRNFERAKSLGADDVVQADALNPTTLANAFKGVTTVFSALGASVSSAPSAGRAGFLDVDVPANRNLIDAAKANGARRFVYVSAFSAPERRDVRYLRAHAEVEDLARASGLSFGIVRPTGFFTAFAEFLVMARKGAVPELGDGSAKTNPIHPKDLAAVCVEALLASANVEVDAGGPDVLSRRQTIELAFEALGRPVSVRRLPIGFARLASAMARPFHPRLGDLGQFLGAISSVDLVAPVRGSLRLRDYFRELAEAPAAAE